MWLKYAHQGRSGQYLHVGEKWWVPLSGPGAVHEVTVTEDPEGDYFGWRSADKPNAVLAFPGNVGTANMMKQTRDAGVPLARVVMIATAPGWEIRRG